MNGTEYTSSQGATTLLFDPGDEAGKGSAGGMAMCNTYNGGYIVEEDTLTLSELSTTMISCADTIMQSEATYLEVLGAAQTYQIFGQPYHYLGERHVDLCR